MIDEHLQLIYTPLARIGADDSPSGLNELTNPPFVQQFSAPPAGGRLEASSSKQQAGWHINQAYLAHQEAAAEFQLQGGANCNRERWFLLCNLCDTPHWPPSLRGGQKPAWTSRTLDSPPRVL